eukprot:jgi/Ulvmu1/1261/UM109_0059.1
MDVQGFKPGRMVAPMQGNGDISEGDVGFGERLSICGQFAINKQGSWRALDSSHQVAMEPAMEGMDSTGKHQPDRSTDAGCKYAQDAGCKHAHACTSRAWTVVFTVQTKLLFPDCISCICKIYMA